MHLVFAGVDHFETGDDRMVPAFFLHPGLATPCACEVRLGVLDGGVFSVGQANMGVIQCFGLALVIMRIERADKCLGNLDAPLGTLFIHGVSRASDSRLTAAS